MQERPLQRNRVPQQRQAFSLCVQPQRRTGNADAMLPETQDARPRGRENPQWCQVQARCVMDHLHRITIYFVFFFSNTFFFAEVNN